MRITASNIVSIIPDVNADQVSAVALTILAVILNLKTEDTVEFDFFRITKMDDYGLFVIDYDPKELYNRFAMLKGQTEAIDPEIEAIIDNLLEKWREVG